MHLLTKRLANLMVGGALLSALILAVAHGAEKGSTWYLKSALIIGLVCVAIGEFLAWHNAATSWHERRAGSMALWAVLGTTLSLGTLYTNFASSASNNDGKAVIQKTAFTKRGNVEEELKAAKADRDRIAARLKWMDSAVNGRAVRTADAAQADIVNAEAHRFFKLTNSCTETKGPQTRSFCDGYAGFKAELALAGEKMTLTEELKAARDTVKDYETKMADGQAVVSDDAPQLGFIKASLNTTDIGARQIDAMILPILVQAMLLFGGILLANEAFRGKTPKPWFSWEWARRLYATIAGIEYTKTGDDTAWARAIKAAAKAPAAA